MQKISSLVDFPKPTLDPNVWDLANSKLNPIHKDFILRILNSFIESRNLKAIDQWIIDITLVGSICTYLYNSKSDIDVHVKVDITKFKETNVPEMTDEEAAEHLDLLRKELDSAKLLLPLSSNHVVEYYFETKFHPANVSRVGVYSISSDKWIKEPPTVPQDFDIEKLKPRIVEEAIEVALGLDENFSKIRQNIIRIEDLIETLKAWPKEKQQLYVDKINEKTSQIEDEMKEALKVKEDLVTERHEKQNPLSDNELIFKWLQHMSYFDVLAQLKELLESTGGEVSVDELPLIEKVISQANLKQAGFDSSYWIDPEGRSYTVDTSDNKTHRDWVGDNLEILMGRELPETTDVQTMQDNMFAHGWTRTIVATDALIFDRGSLDNLNVLDDFISQHWSPNKKEVIIDIGTAQPTIVTDPFPSLAQVVSKTSSMQKFAAFMKKSNVKEEIQQANNKILIDMDDTICHETPDNKCGEPMEGVKEAFTKLKEMGYELEIFSHRANTEEGLDEVKNYLDSHEIPYDSIFQGEKPLAKWQIDDRAIHFDNWDHVLEEVKNAKKASLCIIAYEKKIFQDPTREQAEALLENSKTKMLRWAIGNDGHLYMWDAYDLDHPMARAKLGVDWTLENSGYLGKRIPPSWTLGQYWKSKNLVTAAFDLPVIDPKTFNRKEPYALFIGTGDYGKAGKFDMYNVYGEHPMITEHNQVPTVGLDTLIKNNIPVIGKEPRAGNKQPVQDISSLYRQTKLFSKKEIIAQTKKIKQGDYSCLMALVPHDLAQEIVEFGVRTVPDDKIYLDEDGNLGRELESHITIKYGLLTNDAKDVRRSFNNEKPFKAKLGKVKHFQPPELPFDVLTVEVVSEDLEKANKKVCDNFECAEGLISDEYHPHITVAYMKRDSAKEYIGSDVFEGKELELDILVFSPHKGNRTYFSVSSDKESRFVLEKIEKRGYNYKIGDKVKDKNNGKIGIIKEIIGKEVILEEIYG